MFLFAISRPVVPITFPVYVLVENLTISEVFPTPESPSIRIFKVLLPCAILYAGGVFWFGSCPDNLIEMEPYEFL